MKQVIPFRKELLFKTKVSEVTSISLEHSISSKENNKVSGNFLITGDYKMTESSINRESFRFDIPFEINLDDTYDFDSIIVDIDNFYYEVVNNEMLTVNIDLYIIGDKIKKELLPEDKEKGEKVNDNEAKNNIRLNDFASDDGNDILKDKNVEHKKISKIDNITDNISELEVDTDELNINNNIFDTMNTGDTYVTYYVYIVKEGDTLDKILDKFKVTKEELEKYNDLSDIHEKIKLIIPSNNE